MENKDTKSADLFEKKTDVEINIKEFNPEIAYLEVEEDLTEKVISYIEKEIRTSYEYKQYLKYLKEELDLTKCALLPNIDIKELSISLEFHHYPLNLFEITEAVGKSMISDLNEGESISCFEISEKVMEEHFRNNIGLIPLTKTLHEMAHNRSIIIPINKVNGNYKNFLVEYNNYISDEIKDRISEAEINSITDDAEEFNKNKLEKNILNYNISYFKEEDEDE